MPRARWLPEDDALLTEIWKDPAPIKTQLDKFPGRTEAGLGARATVLKLPDRRMFANTERGAATTFARLQQLLEAKPGTMDELAARAHVSKATVRRFIQTQRADIHILKFRPRGENGYAAAVWTWGPGEDAQRPPPKAPKDCALAYYRRMRRDPFFRAKCSARAHRRYETKKGTWVRRDPAAVALFGPATPNDDSGT
ncbi:hypothetical protein [Burkholderia sp. 4M9327F10]|uniref:hypothetical protein n=2 Tax=Burkholderiaceae TaxID=119060 RepID=UPI0010F85566|nr:hypothetical protein [Burkholderia sp. 4M9327F10]